jgi:outer membrane protein assembly factor BamB
MRKSGQRTTVIKGTTICLFVFLLAISVFGCDQKPEEPIWKPTEKAHKVADDNFLKMLWARENIYIEDSVEVGLATSTDYLFFHGSTDINEPSRLNALNVLTGEPVWKSDVRVLSPIIADETGVYVEGIGTGGNVTKYDPGSGDVLWARDFWDSGGVLHLIIYDDQLHVYLSPDKHKVLTVSDGKNMVSFSPKSPPFFDLGICGTSYQTPIYTDDTIYYRENESVFVGEVCAVDISTGKLRWKSNLGVLSNVIASDDAVFVLIKSGDLLVLNPANGKKISELSVSFDNKPFVPYSVNTTSGNFFLAYNLKNDILLAYLGDSRQLYAFHIQ